VSDSDDAFLRLTFEHGRFAAHSAPVDALAELISLQQLIALVARHLFFKKRPARRRVPRGFTRGGQLYLSATAPNCFTATLTTREPTPQLFPDTSLYVEARDLSTEALRAVSAERALPEAFPSAALPALASLGRYLKGDERLVLRHAHAAETVVNQESRIKLAELTRQPYVREDGLDGEVESIDDVNHRYTLRTRDGLRVEAAFTADQRKALVEALDMRPIVRISLYGKFIGSGSSIKFEEVREFDSVDDERATEVQALWERLSTLAELSDGWLDGDGLAPTELALALARQVLARLLVEAPAIERPKVFPTLDGGVQAEWVFGLWAADVAFRPEGGGLDAVATHAVTGASREQIFDAEQVLRDASSLAGWLTPLSEGPPS
jgi:hypothetical protein